MELDTRRRRELQAADREPGDGRREDGVSQIATRVVEKGSDSPTLGYETPVVHAQGWFAGVTVLIGDAHKNADIVLVVGPAPVLIAVFLVLSLFGVLFFVGFRFLGFPVIRMLSFLGEPRRGNQQYREECEDHQIGVAIHVRTPAES